VWHRCQQAIVNIAKTIGVAAGFGLFHQPCSLDVGCSTVSNGWQSWRPAQPGRAAASMTIDLIRVDQADKALHQWAAAIAADQAKMSSRQDRGGCAVRIVRPRGLASQ
jgi:hypothetical protein